jgi:protein O-mannose beta-1,4-N-acetylglucosaminyltransferase
MSPFNSDLRNITIRYEKLTHFLFKRLHPHNIMHNLHDDVLNLYFLIKKYIGKATEPGIMDLPFSLYAHRLLILDGYEGTESTRPIQYLSNHPIRFFSFLKRDVDITCFRDAILGNTNQTRW